MRKGFFKPKRKRVLVGRGLPPVACSFFSFSRCFLFSSSSFMITGFATSPFDAILEPSEGDDSLVWSLGECVAFAPKYSTNKTPQGRAQRYSGFKKIPGSRSVCNPVPLDGVPPLSEPQASAPGPGCLTEKSTGQGKVIGSPRATGGVAGPHYRLNIDCRTATRHAWEGLGGVGELDVWSGGRRGGEPREGRVGFFGVGVEAHTHTHTQLPPTVHPTPTLGVVSSAVAVSGCWSHTLN